MASYLRYAEVLYKCKLCQSMPAILSSEGAFISHMESIHLGEHAVKNCSLCDLKFTTVEDLQCHLSDCHKQGSKVTVSPSAPAILPQHISRTNPSIGLSNNNNNNNNPSQSPLPGVQSAVSLNTSLSSNDSNRPALSQMKMPSRRGRRLQSDARPDVVMPSSLRSELQVKFGKYASTILIKGVIYFYCQVCMYKTSSEEEFNIHFHCEEHRRTALKLEQPWMQSVPWLQAPASPRRNQPSTNETQATPKEVSENAESSQSATGEGTASDWHDNDVNPPSKKRKSSDSQDSWCSIKQVEQESQCEDDLGTEQDVVDQEEHSTSSSCDASQLATINQHLSSPDSIITSPGFSLRKSLNCKQSPTCVRCGFMYSSFDEYSKHCTEFHGDMNTADTEISFSPVSKITTLESQKVEKLKPHIASLLLPDMAATFVCRDELLTQIQARMGCTGVMQWGAACNRAVRECFPSSGITRRTRGKEDKHFVRRGSVNRTLFTGVRLVTKVGSEKEGHSYDEDEGEEIPTDLIRDISKDTDTLLQELSGLLRWTGDLETSIQRDDLLHYLSRVLNNEDITRWNFACNRAVRHLFPDVVIKRRGSKSKLTFFHGVGYAKASDNELISHTMLSGGQGHLSDIHGDEHHPIKVEQDDTENHNQPLLSTTSLPSSTTEAIACLILLHPGPFVTSDNLVRCHRSKLPTFSELMQAMHLLETLSIGQVYDFEGIKCFFKHPPVKEHLGSQLDVLRVEFERYEEAFAERDNKLEDIDHDKLLADYPFSMELLHKCYQL